MSETALPTKEQIQTSYNQTVGLLGQKVFHFFAPLAEIWGHINMLLSLNSQMQRLLQAEAEEKKKVDEKLGVK